MHNFNPNINNMEDAKDFVMAQTGCSRLQAEDAIVNGTSVDDLGMNCDAYEEAHEGDTSYTREA